MAEESSGQWAGLWRDAGWSAHGREGYTAQSAGQAPVGAAIEIDGRLGLRYVFRTTDDGRDPSADQDFYASAYTRAEKKGVWAAEVDALLAVDVDGKGRTAFFDVDDSYDNGRIYLYRAFAEAQDLGPLRVLRIGRQVQNSAAELYRFDGVMGEAAPMARLKLRLFGGVPAHLFETKIRGDWLVGGDAMYRLAPGTSIRLGYVHLEDRLTHDVVRRDNRVEGTVAHRFGKLGNVRADVSTIDGKATETRLRGLVRLASWGLTVRGGFLGRFGSWQELTTEHSYYDEILVRYEDHVTFDASATWLATEFLALDAGGTIRQLLNESDGGPFNHEFGQWRLGASLIDLPVPGLQVAAAATGWHSETDDILTWSAEVRYRIEKLLEVSLGSDFALYEIDRFLQKERQRTRNVRLKGRGWIGDNVELRLGLSLERDDQELYFTSDAGVEFVF